MTIGGLLQSGGIVADIWKKTVSKAKNLKLKANNILIVGLGCGTAAKLFSRAWPEAKIIGVEIDPEVIRLGKKYFGLGEIGNLKIVCEDAIEYVKNFQFSPASPGFNFQLIVVDIYKGEKIPPKTENLEFLNNLKNLLSKNGLVVFNRIFWDEHKKEAEIFVNKVQKIFNQVELIRTVANLLVVCQQ